MIGSAADKTTGNVTCILLVTTKVNRAYLLGHAGGCVGLPTVHPEHVVEVDLCCRVLLRPTKSLRDAVDLRCHTSSLLKRCNIRLASP